MSIAKKLVELMQGDIVVESRPNRGSTFSFTSHMEKDPDGGTGSDLHDTLPKEDLDLLKGTHILSIDDNAVNTDYLVNLLKMLGCDVDGARSGVNGIEMLKMAALREDPYEILLLDFAMPGMNGLEVAEIVHSSGTIMANSMRLIMLGSIDVHRSIAACPYVHGFTTKPIRRSPLIKMIVAQLKIKRGILIPPISRGPMSLQDTFTIRPSLSGEMDVAAHHGLDEFSAPKCLNPLSILYVEDNLINQKVIVSILSLWKCNVTTALNGIAGYEERVAHNGKKTFDMILCDLHMPSCDGFQCVKLIRDWEQKNNVPRIPICAVTADANPDTMELCLSKDGGFDEFLAKPLRKHALRDMVVKICGADRLGDARASFPSSYTGLGALEPEQTPHEDKKDWSTGVHVLVVDDAPTMRLLLRTFLVDMGCHVSEAATGEDACQFVRRSFDKKDNPHPIELVFCDMRMPPGMNGIETARHIKMIPGAIKLPIIGMTADEVTNLELTEARGAGMVSLISKPIGRSQLTSYLAEYTSTLEGSPRRLLLTNEANLVEWNVPDALELCGDDPHFLATLLRDFAVDLAARREELCTSIQRKDCARVAEVTHDVKGMASICNFSALAHAAGECQQSAAANEYIEVKSKSKLVFDEISKAIKVAKEYDPSKW